MLLREFLPKFLRSPEMVKTETRVGVVMFDNKAQMLNDFTSETFYDKEKLTNVIKKRPIELIFKTRIDKGLVKVRTRLFSEKGGDRKDHANVLVAFTDGRPFPPDVVKPLNETLPPLRVSILKKSL